MQIVIDIPEEDYNRIKDIPNVFESLTSRMYKAIQDGTPLPDTNVGDMDCIKDSSTGSSTTNIGSSTGSTIEALEERTRTHECDSSEHETHEERTEKVGHWIEHEWAEESEGYLISNFVCDKCHAWTDADYAYCPDCGAKMEVGNGCEDGETESEYR